MAIALDVSAIDAIGMIIILIIIVNTGTYYWKFHQMNKYNSDITCSTYSCEIDIYGTNTRYDLSANCNDDFAPQNAVINANNDNSDSDTYAAVDVSYTGNDGSIYTTNSSINMLNCVGNHGCAHLSMYVHESSSGTDSHICYEFSIIGTNYYKSESFSCAGYKLRVILIIMILIMNQLITMRTDAVYISFNGGNNV